MTENADDLPSGADGLDGRLSGYDFALPPELIAQEPTAEREASRLFVLDRRAGSVQHMHFRDIVDLLTPADLLVLNDTRVAPARAFGHREDTGGRIEVLFLAEREPGVFEALVKARGRMPVDCRLALLLDGLRLRVRERGKRGFTVLEIDDPADLDRLRGSLDREGLMPLPPYIKRKARGDPRSAMDRERYQTVYARETGAVAAPTAGLHFSEDLLARLSAKGVDVARVTLHVGLGTFAPVVEEDLSLHRMHAERFRVPPETADKVAEAGRRGGRIVAVGTTVVRSLETAWDPTTGRVVAMSGASRLFMRPPATFGIVNAMITNFHLPKSTLLMLVSAFAGRRTVLDAYAEAVKRRYRFFSYGDAMLVL